MTTSLLYDDLLTERTMLPREVWAAAEARLTKSPREGLNTAVEVCDRWADDPNRVAIVVRHSADSPAESWTFAEMQRSSSRLASALVGLGVRRGDRVAAILPQGIEAHLTALAAWRLGAIFVPIYPGFGVEGLGQRVGHSKPTVVVTDTDSRDALGHALTITGEECAVVRIRSAADSDLPEDIDFWRLVNRHEPLTDLVNTAASETATLLYTSGTTGMPKGCRLPHSYVITMQPFVRHAFALGSGDVFASTSGPGWVNGLYSAGFCVSAGGHTRVIYTGRFDAKEWLRILDQEGVTYFSSAPSAMREILPAIEEVGFPSRLRAGASAGEHQGAELALKWAKHCESPLQETYGTTEIGLVMATPAYPSASRDPGALPEVVPGFELRLVDEHGRPATGDTGILAVRNVGYDGCTGYLDDDARWAERWSDGWYVTGDLARQDEKGQLWFQGRDDDVIVTSGYNVGPAEVEGVLVKHPMVRDVAVVAAPDSRRGSVVRAVVVREPRQDVDAAVLKKELQEHARVQLGRHAYPRIIDFVEELPRNPAGKVERRLLRD